MGTTAGGTKAHQILKEKLGPEGYSLHMASIGAKGGKKQVRKGFAVTRKHDESRETEEPKPEDGRTSED